MQSWTENPLPRDEAVLEFGRWRDELWCLGDEGTLFSLRRGGAWEVISISKPIADFCRDGETPYLLGRTGSLFEWRNGAFEESPMPAGEWRCIRAGSPGTLHAGGSQLATRAQGRWHIGEEFISPAVTLPGPPEKHLPEKRHPIGRYWDFYLMVGPCDGRVWVIGDNRSSFSIFMGQGLDWFDEHNDPNNSGGVDLAIVGGKVFFLNVSSWLLERSDAPNSYGSHWDWDSYSPISVPSYARLGDVGGELLVLGSADGVARILYRDRVRKVQLPAGISRYLLPWIVADGLLVIGGTGRTWSVPFEAVLGVPDA